MKRELLFVFDTNTLISAVMIRTSTPRKAFNKALDQGKILLSPPTLDELNNVLNREKLKPYLLPKERNWLWQQLLGNARLISKITETVTDCRDPKDNMFLELALAGQAACIISGDEDLLVLNPFRKIPVLSPEQFLRRAQDGWL